MLDSGYGNNWGYIDGNLFTDRPAAAMGTSYTLGANNAMGSWESIMTVSQDVYGIYLNFNSLNSSAANRNGLSDIGIDPAGGTSFTPLIKNLLCGKSSPVTVLMGGIQYYFPLFIPAGASIGVRGQTSHIATETGRCGIIVYGRPSRPDRIVYGHAVETLGVNTSTSVGVSITARNNASFGSYTTIGTTTKNWKYLQFGWGISNGTITAIMYRLDIAKGSTDQRLVMENFFNGTTTEQIAFIQDQQYCNIAAGETMRGHIWSSGTAVTGHNVALYGVY